MASSMENIHTDVTVYSVNKKKKTSLSFKGLICDTFRKKKLKLSKRAERHRVRYGLDYYLDLFLDNFFGTILKGGGGKLTVTTEGGMG